VIATFFSFTVNMAHYVIYVVRFHVQILSSSIPYTILTVWIFHRKGGREGGRKEELNINVICLDTF
jgi:hypothetical protein